MTNNIDTVRPDADELVAAIMRLTGPAKIAAAVTLTTGTDAEVAAMFAEITTADTQ
jgi:hypothetical protein